jgi:hypothetical protein
MKTSIARLAAAVAAAALVAVAALAGSASASTALQPTPRLFGPALQPTPMVRFAAQTNPQVRWGIYRNALVEGVRPNPRLRPRISFRNGAVAATPIALRVTG